MIKRVLTEVPAQDIYILSIKFLNSYTTLIAVIVRTVINGDQFRHLMETEN
jgi:hypothetical protein